MRGLRVQALVRVPLEEGALVPGPLEANLLRPAEVVAALRSVAAGLDAGDRQVCLVLPDGLARVALLEPPRGADARDFARFRLAQSLPYPAGEAIVDVLGVARGRFVAAALRRRVVEAYEAAAAEAGLRQERLDIAPLAAVSGLQRHAGSGPRSALILGDTAVSFAAWDAKGLLRAFRSRRRAGGADEPDRLREELARTACLGGESGAGQVRVVGSGAVDVVRAFSFSGLAAEAGWGTPRNGLPVEPAELAWLGAAAA
jgi:hypothetical protein